MDSYLIWLIIDWYDALILDCLWFCHSKKVRIPGTEDMEEYRDYRFHIRQSCIGMALGLHACLAVGALTAIFGSVEKRYSTEWVQYSQGNLFQELLTLN